jgi:hypothetical protein
MVTTSKFLDVTNTASVDALDDLQLEDVDVHAIGNKDDNF